VSDGRGVTARIQHFNQEIKKGRDYLQDQVVDCKIIILRCVLKCGLDSSVRQDKAEWLTGVNAVTSIGVI
jgi:hypothetical protein